MASVKELYWLAGMLEGEGSFYIYTKKNQLKPKSYPELTFQSTDHDVTFRVASIMNARISRVVPYNSSKLRSFKVRLCADKAAQWMMTLYTLMGTRRKAKIKEVLDIWKTTVDGRKKR